MTTPRVRHRSRMLAAIVALAAVAVLRPAPAAQAPATGAEAFDVRDVMIPARDGVRLHTKVFVPKGATEPLPILLRRTPYGIDGAASNFARVYKELAAD